MTPSDIDRVFGRGRLRMVTGEHVEVYREASLPGERRRYTKRFLATEAGDFRHWTEREWRILARLVGHGIGPVPDVVQFDRGAADRPALVQTYDAGVTVDHWATLLPVERDGMVLRHVFEDCAHWWALARHCLIALDAIHELRLVHLDLKADNVCIPFGPPDFEPRTGQVLSPRFDQIALIDFAFSLVSGESLTRALPIVRQTEYDYQSPRLLQALEAGSRGDLMPTRQLDWRCDVFSLAAMLRRYLPDPDSLPEGSWTHARLAQARAMVRRLLAAHDAEWSGQQRPHVEMLALSEAALAEPDLALSLTQGWTLSLRSEVIHTECATPVTRIAAPVSAETHADQPAILRLDGAREERASARRWTWLAAAASVAAIGAPPLYEAWWEGRERVVSHAAPESAPVQAKAASLPGSSRDSAVSEATASTGVGVAVPAPRDRAARPNAASARGVAEARRTPPELAQRSAGASTAVGSAPDPGKPVVSASASPAPATAPVPAAAAMAESPAPRRPAAPAPAAVPSTARAAAPPVRAPNALAKVDRGAKAAAREPEPAAARPTASAGAAPTTDRERALAWLTARGPTPRGAAGPAAGPTAPRATPPGATTVTPTATTAAAAAALTVAAPMPAAMPVPSAVASGAPRSTGAPSTGVAAAAPVIAPTPPPRAEARADDRPAPPLRDFSRRARDMMAVDLPLLAQRAERRVTLVLELAAKPAGAGQDDDIRRTAMAIRNGPYESAPVVELAADDARLLHDEAKSAFRSRGSLRDALDLQLQAFGANPLDAEVVGGLAFFWLKQGPSHAEVARQLALRALVLPDPRRAAVPVEDWTTLAIANALAGREPDARHAWFVSLALAPQPERQCRAAINAYAMHGERLRGSVEAMLYRIHQSGRTPDSALCEWPPHWMARR